MFSGVPLLVLAFSGLNIAYMYFTQYSLYDGFVPEPSIMKLFMAYCTWAMMSIALKKLVVEREDFGFKSVIFHGPILGFLIYFCINVSIMAIDDEWSYDMALADVIWGSCLFGAVTLFALMFKQYL